MRSHSATNDRKGLTVDPRCPAPPAPTSRRRVRSRTLAAVLSLLTLLALGTVGLQASTAVMKDETSLAAVEVHGGTLALEVDGTGIALTPDASTAILPGERRTSVLRITNTGSVPARLSFARTAGIATPDCWTYQLLGRDGRPFTQPLAFDGLPLVRLGRIAPGQTRVVTLEVTMLETCATNGATASLSANVRAVQIVEQP